jgi:hypothetical protein
MKKLVFSDTEEFYKELTEALKSGEEVEVITSYKRFSDLPHRLKQIFELHKYKSDTWVNVSTRAFIPNSVAPVGLNLKALIVLGSTATGAGVGAIFGAIPGAAIGAVIGLTSGAAAAVLMDQNHQVEVEVDTDGRLRIKLQPI